MNFVYLSSESAELVFQYSFWQVILVVFSLFQHHKNVVNQLWLNSENIAYPFSQTLSIGLLGRQTYNTTVNMFGVDAGSQAPKWNVKVPCTYVPVSPKDQAYI